MRIAYTKLMAHTHHRSPCLQFCTFRRLAKVRLALYFPELLILEWTPARSQSKSVPTTTVQLQIIPMLFITRQNEFIMTECVCVCVCCHVAHRVDAILLIKPLRMDVMNESQHLIYSTLENAFDLCAFWRGSGFKAFPSAHNYKDIELKTMIVLVLMKKLSRGNYEWGNWLHYRILVYTIVRVVL